ncbi:MAG: heme anaerobic degradation radical SAM methyltransferase ChuW/HutW [candidate division WOR-3 bacterium]
MQTLAKADRFFRKFIEMTEIDKKWFFGNETDDPLRFAFDYKRTVHPTIRGRIIPQNNILSLLDNLLRQPGKRCKRAVYIHIPFCQTRCLYCGFFQNFTNPYLEDSYIERLIAEIEMASNYPFVKNHPIHAVYIGGGTPSALSVKNIERLLKTIRQNLPLANDYEMTFEARFYEFDDEKIEACLNGGVNRFSLGVQSFNDQVRKSIGRIESAEKIWEKLQYLRNQENAVVVIDLMYGLPLQNMDIWEEDVKSLIKSGIDGGDLYQLIVFEDSKIKEAVEKGVLPKPASIPEQALMFKKGVEIMEKARYRRLSICHWARNTRERNLYNQLAKSGAVIIPFGAGAGGFIDGYTFFIDRDVNSYIQRIDRGEKPVMFMSALPNDYELYLEIIGQMDLGMLNMAQISSTYGFDFMDLISPLLESWQSKGLIKISDGFLELTIAGQFWQVNLTQAILDWLLMLKKEGC